MTERTLSLSLRPKTFDEVLGQEKVVTALKKQLAERVPVALLFSGPAGVGKTTLARIVANVVNEGTLPDGVSPDIRNINASDTNGVDDIRQMVADTQFNPMVGKYRVVILDEAQRLTDAAQNVLLTPLEVEVSSTIWIICTTEPTKLIKPLKDRCVSFQLKPLSSPDVKRLIAKAFAAAKHSKLSEDGPVLFEALEKHGINAPREILMVIEKFLGGVPADEAASRTENEAEFIDVARAVGKGDWARCAEKLKGLKSADLKPLRGMVASYLGSMLLGEEDADSQQAISDCIKGMYSYNGIEEATKAGIYDWLFRSCRRMRKG